MPTCTLKSKYKKPLEGSWHSLPFRASRLKCSSLLVNCSYSFLHLCISFETQFKAYYLIEVFSEVHLPSSVFSNHFPTLELPISILKAVAKSIFRNRCSWDSKSWSSYYLYRVLVVYLLLWLHELHGLPAINLSLLKTGE